MSARIEPSPYPYRHICNVQIRFNDFDRFGHINNTIYLQYMDLGKETYISEVIGDIFDTQRETIVVVNVNCDFCQTTEANEPLQVRTRVDSIGRHSVVFEQEIVNVATEEMKCRSRTVMVGYAPATKETIEILPRWRQAISAYEGRPL